MFDIDSDSFCRLQLVSLPRWFLPTLRDVVGAVVRVVAVRMTGMGSRQSVTVMLNLNFADRPGNLDCTIDLFLSIFG